MMKRWMGLLAALLVLACLGTAWAEMHIGQQPPETWADRETLRIRSIHLRFLALHHHAVL